MTAEGVLLDAFRSIGPLVGSSQADEVRDAAAARLLETLYRLVSPLRMDRGVKDDVVQVVVTRLCRSGPRGVRAGDPESDEALERYLRRALWNALRDRAPRHVTIDWDAIQGMLISNEPSPAAVFEGKARQTRLDETRALLGRVIDDAVGDLGARAATGYRAAISCSGPRRRWRPPQPRPLPRWPGTVSTSAISGRSSTSGTPSTVRRRRAG